VLSLVYCASLPHNGWYLRRLLAQVFPGFISRLNWIMVGKSCKITKGVNMMLAVVINPN
jgi:hypothetical protein